MTPTPEEIAYKIAMVLLRGVTPVTPQDVRNAIHHASLAVNGAVDVERTARLVEAAYNVYVPAATALQNSEEDHEVWLPERRATTDWRLWRRYSRYLEEEKDLPPPSVRRLDDVTDQLLGLLEDPKRSGRWDRRGMVVGHVQSGKTANYTGLICKAADAGYKVIVVLAGIHDSLRSQTQLRLDEGFLGYDTQQRMQFDQTNTRLGVGLLPGVDFYHVNSMTSSAQKGDFKKTIAQSTNISPGGADPLLLVVKKHKSILTNVVTWLTSTQQERRHGDERPRVHGVPILVIDDECDNASVNTKDTFDSAGDFDPDVDPTAVNGAIRRLLDSFEQSAYVGYTATPFANIFIFKDADTREYGEDIFPRSFIINLKRPSDYIGASKVFGLDADPTTGILAEDPLPVVRTVDDTESWIPLRHKSDHVVPDEIPLSLRKALLSFILVCAARRQRGQSTAHNSMLIHVTRFTAVQRQVADLVTQELSFTKDRIRFGDGGRSPGILDEMKALWQADFEPTTRAVGPDEPAAWSDIEPHLAAAVGKIEIRVVNGTARDALDYFGRPAGVSAIAIGGDKLSRGLTLEGLSVSYYLRASKMYDTLLQMGRWFGFRPGYADLCRLFTTEELQSWYRQIALANEELLQQFDEMTVMGGNPEDFGLRVRQSPDGLMITSATKFRSSRTMKLSFAASVSETIMFERTFDVLANNLEAVETLVRGCGPPISPEESLSNHVWTDIPFDDVLAFLRSYRSHPRATKAQTGVLVSYISRQNQQDELTNWTVALLSNSGPETEIGGLHLGTTLRSQWPADRPDRETYSIRRLVSPADELIGLGAAQRAEALKKTIQLWDGRGGPGQRPRVPTAQLARAVRQPSNGLLLLYALVPVADAPVDAGPLPVGIALSFPKSETAQAINYAINTTYWDQELGSE